ncbi:hypothetical protein QTO34_014405 [Cnephaeus nilssonii]|uniref:Uncharacterized protein n=1 Tax=Cnephaeus nilssonii TaxID=3371016 RepID=A0AA40I751_CNENI|nr:hypothetical protein QTO34_014405 [Eptesicus nilssonii]
MATTGPINATPGSTSRGQAGHQDQRCRHLNVSGQKQKRPSRPVQGGFAFKNKWGCPELRALTATAAPPRQQGAGLRLGVWGVRALQTRGSDCQRSANVSSEAGAIREPVGQEKAEGERYSREQTEEQRAALKKQHEEDHSS